MLNTADSEWQGHVFFHVYNTNLNSFACMYVCSYVGVVKEERYQEEGRIDIIGREGAGGSM